MRSASGCSPTPCESGIHWSERLPFVALLASGGSPPRKPSPVETTRNGGAAQGGCHGHSTREASAKDGGGDLHQPGMAGTYDPPHHGARPTLRTVRADA